jgi:hypothetical protein
MITVPAPIQSLNLQNNNIVVPIPPDGILATDAPAVITRKRRRGEEYEFSSTLLNSYLKLN